MYNSKYAVFVLYYIKQTCIVKDLGILINQRNIAKFMDEEIYLIILYFFIITILMTKSMNCFYYNNVTSAFQNFNYYIFC